MEGTILPKIQIVPTWPALHKVLKILMLFNKSLIELHLYREKYAVG